MTRVWIAVAIVGTATVALKAAGRYYSASGSCLHECAASWGCWRLRCWPRSW